MFKRLHVVYNALICLLCARRFTHVHGTPAKAKNISMRPLLTKPCNDVIESFLNLDKLTASKMFGLKQHWDTYGNMSESLALKEDDKQFDDWHLRVPFGDEQVKILCCPEDVICSRIGAKEHSSKECCVECSAPVCKECEQQISMKHPSLPPAALANDMMIYYAPTILYSRKVTMMEMICASVCITSMICFTLEKKYRNIRSFEEVVHSNSRRMAYRGNGTSFPLPWQDLLLQLKSSEHSSVPLPRVGSDLQNVVSIL